MNKKDILRELEETLQSTGITVKYESISGDGGYCKYKEKEFVILNKVLPLSARISLLKNVLNELLLKKEDVFIKPALREFLEEE
ncbi:MAG: hypothetical protein PHW02_05475 [bacterium]|nr:hypothetical protein [bacterium]